jgi:hypothetical protein
MKKPYSKPDIMFESFSLSSNIALCDVRCNTPTENQCGYRFGAEMLFVSSVIACTTPVLDGSIHLGGRYDGLCYHNPHDQNNLFGS